MIKTHAALILLGSMGCAALTGALRLAAEASRHLNVLFAAGAAFGAALGVLSTGCQARPFTRGIATECRSPT